MSRAIDPFRISPRDLEYLKQRPLLVQEFEMQELGNPLAEDYPYLVDDEGNYLNGDPDEDSTPEPSTDDFPEDGGPYGLERPEDWDDLDDEQKQEYLNTEPEPETATDPVEELPADQQWKSSFNKDELEAVINARNKGREDDDQIDPGDGKAKTLKEALKADDEALREAAEGDEGDES